MLGPCVIAVVFAWNNLWQRKLAQLPDKYKKDALPTLLYGMSTAVLKFSFHYLSYMLLLLRDLMFLILFMQVLGSGYLSVY